ncbi:MAG: Na+/H+ antiporter subunit C [Planctomycetes bacterium]|jgi:multicomponent Na+:H+ antiporter subunit C|nr:Na+/H+ antiporter subunit C [Planctomycetota bacterium]
MNTVMALLIGMLYASGMYMVLRRSMVKLIIGLALLSHAANLLIFTMATLRRDRPPLIDEGETALAAPYADPVPQALILTAIVIGFAVSAFAAIMIYRVYQTTGTDDLDQLHTTDS